MSNSKIYIDVNVEHPISLRYKWFLSDINLFTFKGRKINVLKYSRVIHQKKRLEPLMIKQKFEKY